MEKSKLIEILRTFTADEIKRFKDFINSPYFNTNKNIVKLFDILRPLHPDYPAEKIVKEKIFARVYPGKKYNEQIIKNLSSDFIKLSKEFLGQQFYESSSLVIKDLNILRQLNSKRLNVLYNKERNNLLNKLTNVSGIDRYLFDHLFHIEVEQKSFLLSRDKPVEVGQLNSLIGQHNLFTFLVNGFTIINEMEINSNVFATEYDSDPAGMFIKKCISSGIIDEMFEDLEKNNAPYREVVSIYYYLMKAYADHENEEYYDIVEKLILDNLLKFNRTEKHLITNALLNICINQLKRGNNDAYKKALDIFKIQLKHNIHKIADDEIMTVFKFRNIFFVGLQLKEYDWLESYLNNYSNELSEDVRENIYNNLYAHLCFYKKEFDKALEHINKVKFDRIILKVDVKNLTLLIYYELNHLEAALSMIDSYRHFISSAKDLSDLHKEGCSTFINTLNPLIKLKSKFSEPEFVKLKNKISETPHLSGKDWFIEKLDELGELNLSKVS